MATKLSNKSEDDVPPYSSSDESENLQSLIKRKRGEAKKWTFVTKYPSASIAEEAVKNEKTWSIITTHVTMDGNKRFYRCNKVPRKGEQCTGEIYLLYEADSDAVAYYRSVSEHNHDSITKNYNFGISKEAKSEINKLFALRLKPKIILKHLENIKGLRMPTMRQLNNYLAELRRRNSSEPCSSTIHLDELERWLISRSTEPDDDCQIFVLAFSISEGDPATFRFILSSKSLLKQYINAEFWHVDSTHKLIWQGFPVFIIGSTDKRHNFHPICLTVSTHDSEEDFKTIFMAVEDAIFSTFSYIYEPKVIVCDTGKSIQNAFVNVFGKKPHIRTCWSHAKKKIWSKLDQIADKEVQKSIFEDIIQLQAATSPEVFAIASKAFLEKWENEKEFISYFEQEWLNDNSNWYLGAAPVSPATNNALESFVKRIKNQNKIRERIPLSKFLEIIEEMVIDWSQKALTEEFATTPELQLPDWTDAYQLANSEITVTLVNSTETNTKYLVPGDGISKAAMTKSFENFDEYKKVFFSAWKVTLPNDGSKWSDGNCDCPDFYRKYICKHVLGLAINSGYVMVPDEVKNNKDLAKRKRGRPPKTPAAIVIR